MAAQRGRSGRRGGVVFLVVVLVILALAVAGDRLAVKVADQQVSKRLQTELGTSTAPTVDIEGFPFLTQVLARTLSSVHVQADNVSSGGVNPTELSHVDLRMHGVTSANRFKTVNAARVTGTASVDYRTAQKMTGRTLTYAKEGRVQFSVATTLLNLPVTAKVVGRPVVDVAAQTLTLGSPEINVAGVDVPDTTSAALLSSVLKPQPIVGIPFGLSITSITATPDGLVAAVTGNDVSFSR